MRLIEAPYQTPEGYVDFPFAYVYNTSAFADGQAQVLNISQQLQGDSDFILRAIRGVRTTVDTAANGGRFNYKNASSSYAFGNPSAGIVVPNNWVVLPEKTYKINTQINFDLYKTLRASTVCAEGTIYKSSIAFMGVKRFPFASSGYRSQKTPYAYREFPQTYVYSLTITQPSLAANGVANAPLRYTQVMDNYDFELCRITVSLANATGALTTNDFAMTLYDANMHQTSSAPLMQTYFNAGKPTASTLATHRAVFPVPSLVYPAGAAITFDITSLLCSASVPQTYNIDFEGIWRLPCSGRNPGW